MGYTTEFEGKFKIEPQLPGSFVAEVNDLLAGRHDGQGWSSDPYNYPSNNLGTIEVPRGAVWCQWELENDGEATCIEWNGAEKFYFYKEWMENILAYVRGRYPSMVVDGRMMYRGEDMRDVGIMTPGSLGRVVQTPLS